MRATGSQGMQSVRAPVAGSRVLVMRGKIALHDNHLEGRRAGVNNVFNLSSSSSSVPEHQHSLWACGRAGVRPGRQASGSGPCHVL